MRFGSEQWPRAGSPPGTSKSRRWCLVLETLALEDGARRERRNRATATLLSSGDVRQPPGLPGGAACRRVRPGRRGPSAAERRRSPSRRWPACRPGPAWPPRHAAPAWPATSLRCSSAPVSSRAVTMRHWRNATSAEIAGASATRPRGNASVPWKDIMKGSAAGSAASASCAAPVPATKHRIGQVRVVAAMRVGCQRGDSRVLKVATTTPASGGPTGRRRASRRRAPLTQHRPSAVSDSSGSPGWLPKPSPT